MNAFSRGTEAKSEIGISKLETNSNFQLPNFRNSVIDHVLNFVVRSFGFVSDLPLVPATTLENTDTPNRGQR
jgi:hypothetical protein